jgi:tRNA threonylcarbamoyladenosine biosynthesis protein TsaB
VLILGIETSTQKVGCAIGGHEGVLAMFELGRGRRHAETLVPAIEFTCKQARIDLDEISVVAVDIGPGLFTGLRVGVAAAKAMASALRVPMIGVASLDLLALAVRTSPLLIAAVIDARKGEVYSGFYRQVPAGVQRVRDHRVGSPEDLLSELVATGEDCLLVGDGAHRYAELLQDGLGRAELAGQWLASPSAAQLVQLAHAHALREQWVNPWELEPLYLRKPDAEINWETRYRRRP